MSDLREILDGDSGAPKESGTTRTRRLRKHSEPFKRPEGMHRELYALLCSDNRDPPTLTPTDTSQGYKQTKAKIGRSKVRSWKLTKFTNPARTDGLVLQHWRRQADEEKEYAFARFNKVADIIDYSDEEYNLYLHCNDWSREETDHLFDLCRLFDARFIVVFDRYDHDKYKGRTLEDIKARYYTATEKLTKARTPAGQEPLEATPVYDAEHEKNRKTQLLNLFNRTQEQVEEEELLVTELKKIELRKKERDKKQQDLQKLITAAENKPALEDQESAALKLQKIKSSKKEKKQTKKRFKKKKEDEAKAKQEQNRIKFPEMKGACVYLQSSRLKFPPSLGTKKSKAVEQLLDELGVELLPMPTEDICKQYNELRNDLLLLYELKQAMSNCEFELQSLKHRYEAMSPSNTVEDIIGFSLDIPDASEVEEEGNSGMLIDVVASPIGHMRKRRSTLNLLDANPWKKTRKT